jgi:cardiolipin synthase
MMPFPVFGVLFYLQTLFLPKKQEKKERKEAVASKNGYGAFTPVFRYLESLGFFAYTDTEAVYFHNGADMIDALVREIKRAMHSIYLEYFIVEEGLVWDRILSALTERARYGVDIRIIIDDMGCFSLHPRFYASAFLESGIKFSVFNPFRPFISSRHNNRDHRKFAVIDGAVAFTGGINLADEYINESCPYNYFKDSAIMLRGDAAVGIEALFLETWHELQKNEKKKPHPRAKMSAVSEVAKENRRSADGFFAPFTDSPTNTERVSRSLYSGIIGRAVDSVYISTPYLVPDDMILDSLIECARGGVDVRIIVPYEPDKRVVKACGCSYYERLISAGVRIFEYEGGFNHAKIICADGEIGIMGSTNLDYRSMHLNYEGGVLIYKSSVISEIYSDLSGMMLASREVEKSDLKKDLVSKLWFRILRLFSPFM